MKTKKILTHMMLWLLLLITYSEVRLICTYYHNKDVNNYLDMLVKISDGKDINKINSLIVESDCDCMNIFREFNNGYDTLNRY